MQQPARLQAGRPSRRPLHGVLLLDKPLGLSSNDALQRVKRLLRAQKAGHTGTLDPLATGVLPLCFGAATKFSGLHLHGSKRYVARMQLGVTTTTGDAEGDVVQTRDAVAPSPAQWQQVLQRMTGAIWQKPPMYAALKHQGRPLYAYARAGQTVQRPLRQIQIDSLQVEPTDDPLQWDLHVQCGAGTYIRVLAEDIGQALGYGAHLRALRRVATGGFTVEHSITEDQLRERVQQGAPLPWLPTSALLGDAPKVTLTPEQAGRFLTGARLRLAGPAAEPLAVWGSQPQAFLGMAKRVADELIALRLLSPIEIEQTLSQQEITA